MTEVTISNLPPVNIPSEWNELTREQLLFVCTQLKEYDAADEFTKAAIQTSIALHFVNLPIADRTDFVAEQLRIKLLPQVQFLFTGIRLTKQLLPKIRIRKHFLLKLLYGPAENFLNLSFEEFDDAEFWLDKLKEKEEQEKALNMFCAILYRPFMETKGDTRIPYSPHDNAERAKWFEYCDAEIRIGILTWYMGCRHQLCEDFEPLFKAPPKGGSNGESSWTMIAHSLAGTVLGTVDDVMKRPVRQVFTEMLRLFNNAEELEALKEKD